MSRSQCIGVSYHFPQSIRVVTDDLLIEFYTQTEMDYQVPDQTLRDQV